MLPWELEMDLATSKKINECGRIVMDDENNIKRKVVNIYT